MLDISKKRMVVFVLDSDLAPGVENAILSQMATNSMGFQAIKIGFFE